MRTLIAALAVFFFVPVAISADELVETRAFLTHVYQANTVLIGAYTLQPNQAIVRALRDAAGRGAHIELVLSGSGEGYAVEQNGRLVEELCGSSVVRFGPRFDCNAGGIHVVGSARPLHMKGAVLDGGRGGVFVTDTNFSTRGTLLQLDPSYAITVERALVGDPQSRGSFTTTKPTSLAIEAALITRAQHSVVFSTESFDQRNPVYAAVVSAMNRRLPVEIIVGQTEYEHSPQEQAALRALGSYAVVHVSDRNEKFAIVDGTYAWIGSTNATDVGELTRDQIDWGYVSVDQRLIETLMRNASTESAY